MSNPLDGKAVTVMITLPASELPLNQRPFTVAFGIEAQTPTFKEGVFQNLEETVRTLWWQFVPEMEEVANTEMAGGLKPDAEQKPAKPGIAEPTLSLF